jgi:hypothetical protein
MTEERLPEIITNLVPMKRREENINQNKCGMKKTEKTTRTRHPQV